MNLSGARLLVVDDDAFDRLACRRALAGKGTPGLLAEASTGEQALALCAENSYDCVLLDYRLPDINGIDLMHQLPQPADDVPMAVVMLTGTEDTQIAVEAMRRGASDYLVKDAEGRYQTLMPTVVHRALRERLLRRERRQAELAIANYRRDLQDLTKRLLLQEKEVTRRLAQSLHDQLGQTLAAMRLSLDAVGAATPENRLRALDAAHPRLTRLIEQAVREVRQVLVDLRPPLLDERGLVAAIDNELREQALLQGGVSLSLDSLVEDESRRWPSDVEYATFMIAREAVSNALRHAGAKSISVQIEGARGWLRLLVDDDGCGIADAALRGRPGHLGLVGMNERSLAVRGKALVERREGGGTRVSFEWHDQGDWPDSAWQDSR